MPWVKKETAEKTAKSKGKSAGKPKTTAKKAAKKEETVSYELVLNYLKQRGYKTNQEGTQKYAYFIYLYYTESVVKKKKVDLQIVSENVAKKFKCSPGSVEQATRYLTITRYPDKTRQEVLDYFVEELQKITANGNIGALEGSKIDLLISDRYCMEVMRAMTNSEIDVAGSLDIFVERPKGANGDSPFYEIGIMDSKQSRVVLRTSSALSVGEAARNQRLADIFYCFDICKFIYKEIRTGNNTVQVKVYTDPFDFWQGEEIKQLTVE